jgi:hypothetical protein
VLEREDAEGTWMRAGRDGLYMAITRVIYRTLASAPGRNYPVVDWGFQNNTVSIQTS